MPPSCRPSSVCDLSGDCCRWWPRGTGDYLTIMQSVVVVILDVSQSAVMSVTLTKLLSRPTYRKHCYTYKNRSSLGGPPVVHCRALPSF